MEPYDPSLITPGIDGTDAAWRAAFTNGRDLYLETTPPIVELTTEVAIGDGESNTRIWTWMLRGNRDRLTVRFRARAIATGGTATLHGVVGGTSTSASVSGALATYQLDVVPPRRGPIVCELRVTTPALVTLDIEAVQVYLVGANASTPPVESRFVRVESWVDDTDEPIASGTVSELLANPIRVARERPACVSQHVVRANLTGGAKALHNWHVVGTTTLEPAGRLRLPRCSERARDYVLDAFTLESTSGARAVIAIGGATWELSSFGGSAGRWHTGVVRLPPGPHDVRCSILAGAGNTARVATFQAWRLGNAIDG